MTPHGKAAVLGGGNIGTAIALGLAASRRFRAEDIIVSRRNSQMLAPLAHKGFATTTDNRWALQHADVIILAVAPQQLDPLLNEIADAVDHERHLLISVVSGVSIQRIQSRLKQKVEVVRAMPNTAIALHESMTCLAAADERGRGLATAREIFDTMGKTLVINEELMGAATSLCACGVAFFLRAIRAASQGGIEIGFHAKEAIFMAAQTARGAASLLTSNTCHPEREIDKVTTPKGITITGLNEMEHRGFSSAMIKGITTSAKKADQVLTDREE